MNIAEHLTPLLRAVLALVKVRPHGADSERGRSIVERHVKQM